MVVEVLQGDSAAAVADDLFGSGADLQAFFDHAALDVKASGGGEEGEEELEWLSNKEAFPAVETMASSAPRQRTKGVPPPRWEVGWSPRQAPAVARPPAAGWRCRHCGTDKTPQRREGPEGRSTLCNACGVRYRQGRLLPEYRPLASPSFEPSEHANRHSQVLQLHRQRKGQKNQPPLPTEQPRLMDDLTGALACSGDGDDPMNVLLPRRWHDKDEYPRTPLHQPLPQPEDSLPGDPRVGGIDATAQGRGGRGNDPNGAPSSLDSLLLEGPSAPLIDDGDESLIE